jgi:hypothetical protein
MNRGTREIGRVRQPKNVVFWIVLPISVTDAAAMAVEAGQGRVSRQIVPQSGFSNDAATATASQMLAIAEGHSVTLINPLSARLRGPDSEEGRFDGAEGDL